ncbi:MAG: ribonuclease H-like domain-containing protein, partial [Rhodospirillales bacterium]
MLKNTFIHLPGVGLKKEKELWEKGVLTWDDFEKSFLAQQGFFDLEIGENLTAQLAASREALAKHNYDFFAERLPKNEHYRIALTIPEQTAFLDIETTGLSRYYDEITVIGFSMAGEYKAYIKGTDWRSFKNQLSRANCLVTFNGTIFDLKFIQNEFADARLPKAHVDLRFFAKRVGLTGGQKAIETTLGIERPNDVKDMIGERAPLLWHEYRMGDHRAGKLLIEYNHADVEGMREIFDRTLERYFEKNREIRAVSPSIPFSKDRTKLLFAQSKTNPAKNKIFIPPYRKKLGPKITYAELTEEIGSRRLRIVGIDITGSESRPTGWCFLEGNRAYTKRVHTDAEIYSETINVEPDIVSIDSPLSLPKGRTRVTDDDPKRGEIGIVRKCEKILFKRGVGVYPCLIQSMQQLTARGIRLATHFRNIGIPVIESYPGAAQDIMDIPRKRAGLDYLAKGLADFGLEGDFATEKVSHDELDAITSAVVGLFFWSGKFEPLGDEDEDYLIIPDLKRTNNGWSTRKVVGISGPIAAGKTTAARYLEEKQKFSYGRFSLVLEGLLRKEKKKVNRKTLQEIGDRIHKNPGQRWLCKQVANSLNAAGNLVIDGLRFPED